MLLEFYSSLHWIFQTTIILWLLWLLTKWFGGAITAFATVLWPPSVIIGGVLIAGLWMLRSLFTVLAVFKLLFTLL